LLTDIEVSFGKTIYLFFQKSLNLKKPEFSIAKAENLGEEGALFVLSSIEGPALTLKVSVHY
jgi:hypothetical protein